jgi:hypothetical protein
MLNVVTMACRHYGQSDGWKDFLVVSNLIFVAIFTAEAVLKMYGLGLKEYFRTKWNRFDFIIVVLSYVGLAFNFGSFATLLRVGRVARIFRLVQTHKGLLDLFKTLIFSLPSIFNVATVTLLLFFIYAVAGMNIFANIKYQDNLTRHANFDGFWSSMLLLFRMATGESYNGVMHDCMVSEPVCSDSDGNCGPHYVVTIIYFLTFFIFSAMLLLNLLVAIILDNFGDTQKYDKSDVKEEDLKVFQDVWAKFDPLATGFIPVTELINVLINLPFPLGLNKETGDSPKEKLAELKKAARKKMGIMNIPERNGNVSFHETLSKLVSDVVPADVDSMSHNTTFNELPFKMNNKLKKANKDAYRLGHLKPDGVPFTVEESAATTKLQSLYRGYRDRTPASKN